MKPRLSGCVLVGGQVLGGHLGIQIRLVAQDERHERAGGGEVVSIELEREAVEYLGADRDDAVFEGKGHELGRVVLDRAVVAHVDTHHLDGADATK